MFDADRPIQKSEQDRLNRALFSKYLARCILDHHDPESLVIGLYGGWGVGKTSVLNLMLEELNFAATNLEDKDKPIILNFSAWSYSGQGQLIYSFFRRLSSALRSVDYLENSERIIHLLELYVSFFTKQPIPKALRTKRSFWQQLRRQGKEDIYAWESGRDLTLVKAELNELLRKQNHKIIIIIDNISRLYPAEVKQIFQIVKSMGDYANTAYVLAFDKGQVIGALNQIDVTGGKEFIEKIVQLPFDIPPILQQDLESIFSDRLSEVLAIVPEDTWNTDYWASVYYSTLKFCFENCRDITRYVNTLNFSYSRLKDVVNPVDFFALTAIEVFMPSVYFGIRDNKDLFSDLMDHVYKLDADQIAAEKARTEEILARENKLPREVLLSLLMQLFPRIRRIYEPNVSFYYSDAVARKLRRISSPDLFDVYFRLSMQIGQLPYAEFETILQIAGDKEAFDQALTRLNQDNRILKFLDQLDSKVIETLPAKDIPSIIDALLDNGDLFPQGNSGLLSLDTPQRIHRIIHALLLRLGTAEERFLVMQNAIAKADKSIYIIVCELREQNRQHHDISENFLPVTFRDLTPEQLIALQNLAVSRIENWAQTGRLYSHPRLLAILFAWRDFSDSNHAQAFVKTMTDSDSGLVAFLMAALDKPINQAMTEYEKKTVWEDYLKNITPFIEPKALVEHAKKLFEDQYFEKLKEKEQLALMIFLDLIKAHTLKVIPNT